MAISLPVSSGVILSNVTVGSGVVMNVLSGGTAVATLVTGGGAAVVSSGGTAVATVLGSSGSLVVSSGGLASGVTALNSTATESILNGGTVVNSLIGTAGMVVSSGGVASAVTVAGGSVSVASGGTVTGLNATPGSTVNDSGVLNLVSGNVVQSVAVSSQGVLNVGAGSLLGGTVTDSGTINLMSGASGTNLSVGGVGLLNMSAGSLLGGTTTDSGTIKVLSGATVGGVLPGAVVNGANLVVSNGGTVLNTALSGVTMTVSSGGTITGDTLGLNTNAIVSGGTATAVTVGSGATLSVGSGVVNGTVVGSGGSLTVASGGLASNTTLQGGTIAISGGTLSVAPSLLGQDAGTINFGSSGGTLMVGGTTPLQATVGPLMGGDVIDLTTIGTPLTGSSYSVGPGDIVTVSGTSGTTMVHVSGVDSGGALMTVSDGLGGIALVGALSAPTGLTLDPGSDSGVQNDDITNNTRPLIDGSGTANDTIILYANGNQVASGTIGSTGSWSLSPINGLADGTYSFTAKQSLAGLASPASTALSVTIDTTAPAAPVITLDTSSDSGVRGDDRTNDKTPTIDGSGGGAGDAITLYSNGHSVGSTTVGSNGNWSITLSSLADGTYNLTATEQDVAGNLSAASMVLPLVIDTAIPDAPTALALAAGSDSGVAGDRITSDTTPTIAGSGIAGDTVTVYDGTLELGTTVVAANFSWSFNIATPLSEGVHTLTATHTSPAGNTSAASNPLSLTIDTTPSAAPTGLTLAPASDTGVKGDGITANKTPAITGTAAAGDTVILFDGSLAIGSATVGSNGVWSVTTSALGDGSHSLTAQDRDPAGNLSSLSAPLSLTIDTVPPPAPTGLALAPGSDSGVQGDDRTNDKTPTIDGSGAVAGDAITLYSNGHSVGSTTVGSSGAWSITLSSLADGTYNLTATEQDVAGNLSAASTALPLVIDTAIPNAPTALTLASGSDSGVAGDRITNDTTPTIAGSGIAGDTVTLYDGTLELGTTVVAANFSWSFNIATPLSEGVHTLTATHTSPAGNTSAASNPLSLTIDTTPSAAPTGLTLASASDTGAKGDGITADKTPAITGTATAGDTVILFDGSLAIGSATVGSNGVWSVTTSALGDGSHSLTAQDRDPAGNLSALSAPLSLTIDSVPPPAPTGLALAVGSDSGTVGEGITNDATPSFTGTGSAGDSLLLFAGGSQIGSGTIGADGSWSVTSTQLANGSFNVTARVVDVAGNLSAASAGFALTIDTARPGAPSTPKLAASSDSGVRGDNMTDNTTPTLTGTGTAGETVILTAGTVTVGQAVVASDGTWSITSATLADGTYAFAATQQDVAGNSSAASAAQTITIDNTPPASPAGLTLASGSDSGTQGDNLTNDATPTITGTGPIGDTVILYDGGTALGIGTIGSAGTWSIATSMLQDGTHALTARAEDAAGNLSAASASLSLTIDTTPPSPPTDLSLDPASDSATKGDGITNDATPTIDGDGVAGSTISLYDGTLLLGTTIAGSDGTWSFTSPVLADGTHDIVATMRNAAGNESGASSPLALTINATGGLPPPLFVEAPHTDPASPTLFGYGRPLAVATFYDGSTILGTTTCDGTTGTYLFDTPTPLSVGTHALTVTLTDTAGNTSDPSLPVTAVVNADHSYVATYDVVSANAAPDGSTVAWHYNSSGAYTQVDSVGADGLTTQVVTPTSTLRNIYDTAGNLIGTSTSAGSPTGSPINMDFTTTRQANSATTVTESGDSVVRLLGESNILTLTGAATVDMVGGAATINAGAGDVVVNGGTGALTFFGGSAGATVSGGTGSRILVGGAGGGMFTASSAGRAILAASGGNTTLVGAANGDVLFAANAGNTVAQAGAGTELLIGGAGASTLIGGTGGDVLFGGSGSTSIAGGVSGDDTVIAGMGTTQITLQGGEIAYATLGTATIYGSQQGNDVLTGGGTGAVMVGGGGNTEFIGAGGHSSVFGGAGNDTVFSGVGDMQAILGAGNDTLILESGRANMFAGTGIENFEAIAGAAGGAANIYNFDPTKDHIDLFGYTKADVTTSEFAGSTVLLLNDHTTITLVNITEAPTISFG